MHHRVVRLENVPAALGKAVRSLNLGFVHDATKPEAAKVIYETSTGYKFVTVRVEPSVSGPNQVYVAINIERRFQPGDPSKFVQFDLKSQEWVVEDLVDAKEQLANVLKSIEQLGSERTTHNGA
jgi:hypothetical protein